MNIIHDSGTKANGIPERTSHFHLKRQTLVVLSAPATSGNLVNAAVAKISWQCGTGTRTGVR
jgi:hypothetical protein